jgi:hypothetical protein
MKLGERPDLVFFKQELPRKMNQNTSVSFSIRRCITLITIKSGGVRAFANLRSDLICCNGCALRRLAALQFLGKFQDGIFKMKGRGMALAFPSSRLLTAFFPSESTRPSLGRGIKVQKPCNTVFSFKATCQTALRV